jgi:hypothetical protein
LRPASSVGYHGTMNGATGGPPNELDEAVDATEAVRAARRGFRRDVAGLIAALQKARVLVPLAKRIEELPVGMEQHVGDELSLSPHLLFDDDRVGYLPVFTRAQMLERATDQVGWGTGEGGLEYAGLPGPVILELALAVVDDDRVEGLLLNPLDETELILHRHEIASIAQGRAVPLVGYVGDIPFGEDEERLVAQMEGPPPPDVVEAIEEVLQEANAGLRYVLAKTFNAERDLEPHLTLNVMGGSADLDRSAVANELASVLDGILPPPGYIDILFDDPKLV